MIILPPGALSQITDDIGAKNYSAAADPTYLDDAVGSGGNGRFTAGARWLNTTTGVWWVCESAGTGIARWRMLHASKTLFGGYRPKRWPKVLDADDGLNEPCVDHTIITGPNKDTCTTSNDTEHWQATDGAAEQSIKLTCSSAGAGWRGVAVVHTADLTDGTGTTDADVNKHIGVRFYIDAASAAQINYLWFCISDGTYVRTYPIYKKDTGNVAEGWHTVYIVPSDWVDSSLSTGEGDFDLSAVAHYKIYMQTNSDATTSTCVSIDEIFTIAAPTAGHFLLVCEGCYVRQKRLLEYLRTTYGGYGSIACSPGRLTTPGSTYISWETARALRDAGHFPYMYLEDKNYGAEAGGEAWGSTADADKIKKILFTRDQLRLQGVIDEMGGYTAALRGSGWSAADAAAFLGYELYYLPTNVGINGYRLRSTQETFGKSGFSEGTIAEITKAADSKGLVVFAAHASAETGESSGYYLDYCISVIDAAAVAGLQFITIRDLLTGNII